MNEEQWDATKAIIFLVMLFESPIVMAGYLQFGLSEAIPNAMFLICGVAVAVMMYAGWRSRGFKDKALRF